MQIVLRKREGMAAAGGCGQPDAWWAVAWAWAAVTWAVACAGNREGWWR